jgi:hypothetical protein
MHEPAQPCTAAADDMHANCPWPPASRSDVQQYQHDIIGSATSGGPASLRHICAQIPTAAAAAADSPRSVSGSGTAAGSGNGRQPSARRHSSATSTPVRRGELLPSGRHQRPSAGECSPLAQVLCKVPHTASACANVPVVCSCTFAMELNDHSVMMATHCTTRAAWHGRHTGSTRQRCTAWTSAVVSTSRRRASTPSTAVQRQTRCSMHDGWSSSHSSRHGPSRALHN